MDLSHFQERLSALGADLSRWPVEEAEAAVALLAVSDDAVAALAEASGGLGEPGGETEMADAVLNSVFGKNT